MESPDKDVTKLPHYTQFKLQPIEFFRANIRVLDFLQMCVIKYVCRYKLKNGKEDLLKARNYIDMMIEDWDRNHPQPRDPRECSSECTGCGGRSPRRK